MRTHSIVAAAATAILVVGSVALAGHLAPLSPAHTGYGVSQYIAKNFSDFDSTTVFGSLNVTNPNERSHVFAVLFYERRIEGDISAEPDAGTPGLFLGCLVETIPPHGSLNIAQTDPRVPDSAADHGSHDPKFVQVISVPRQSATVAGRKTRVANGLGVTMEATGFGAREHVALLYPELFRLPFDQVAAGQRQDAVDCICGGLSAKGLPGGIFAHPVFGIGCP